MKKFLCFAFIFMLASVGYAGNPVTVDNTNGSPDGTTTFSTIQSAIDSWCPTGTNYGETAPFTINVVNGPYDELVCLDQSDTASPRGDIKGDIVIQAASQVTVKLRNFTLANGFLVIYQSSANVTLRNLVLCPSVDPSVVATVAYLVRLGEIAGAGSLNTCTFENVILTESDSSGVPCVTSKTETLSEGYASSRSGKLPSASAVLIQKRGNVTNAGGLSLVMDGCILYGSPNVNAEIYCPSSNESATITNCMNAWCGGAAWRELGVYTGTFSFTGTDQTAGPLNCNAVINPGGNGTGAPECIQLAPTAGSTGAVTITKSILVSTQAYNIMNAIRATGNANLVNVTDSIIDAAGYCLGLQPANAVTIDNVTFNNNWASGTNPYAINVLGAAAGSVTVTDSIFSGIGTKIFGSVPTGGVNIDYSAFVESGADAITARGTYTDGTHNINADPAYVNKTYSSSSFFDVNAAGYGGKATSAGDLAGGADYVYVTEVKDWASY